MIVFPGDDQLENPTGQSFGVHVGSGGAERYSMINANKITVYDIDASTASIKNATITTAKIGDLQVSEAKIGNLAVSEAKIANLAVSEGKIANLAVTNAKINDLSAAKINTGTLTVGSGGATAIAIKRSSAKSDAIVKWEGGSALWTDSNNYMGQWATGGQMYFWCGNDTDPRIVLVTGTNQNSIYGGLRIHEIDGSGGNLNVEGDVRINGNLVVDGTIT
jgi:hypothetical protein